MNAPVPKPQTSPVPQLMSAPTLMTAALKEREPILDLIMAQKSLMMLYDPCGLGKTHLALGFTWASAAGYAFVVN